MGVIGNQGSENYVDPKGSIYRKGQKPIRVEDKKKPSKKVRSKSRK